MDMADDLLSRLNQALAGADADESDAGASLQTSFVASPPRPATAGGGRGQTPDALGEQSSSARLARMSPPLGAAGGSTGKARPQSAGVGGLRGWGDGNDDDVDEASGRDVDEEDPEDQMLISLEIREARSLPAAVTRSTGECYVELQRRTPQGAFARLNPAQSRVRSVKTSRVKRSWGDTRSDRVVRWSGGQCIDVIASSRDCLVLSLWDYKTIGNDVKVGVARIECAELTLSNEKDIRYVPVCSRSGQEVAGSNGLVVQICVSIAASPIAPDIRAEKEWNEDAATAERNPPKRSQSPCAAVPFKTPPLATPVLDALMLKLGSHCEHGGEALTFLGLDADGRVSARQLAAGMDRLGHPRLDLEALGRELQTGWCGKWMS